MDIPTTWYTQYKRKDYIQGYSSIGLRHPGTDVQTDPFVCLSASAASLGSFRLKFDASFLLEKKWKRECILRYGAFGFIGYLATILIALRHKRHEMDSSSLR